MGIHNMATSGGVPVTFIRRLAGEREGGNQTVRMIVVFEQQLVNENDGDILGAPTAVGLSLGLHPFGRLCQAPIFFTSITARGFSLSRPQ